MRYVSASPGVGKSHLMCGLGHALIEVGRRVLFTRRSDLVQRLQGCRLRGANLRLPQELAKLDRFDLLILDDQRLPNRLPLPSGSPRSGSR